MFSFLEFIKESKKVNYDSPHIQNMFKRANLALSKPEYKETKDGQRIRQWKDPNLDFVKYEDVRQWLLGKRVIEDLDSGLEYVRPQYIKSMIKNGLLRKDNKNNFYWITAKAAFMYKLPKVIGQKFPE